jgi:GTP-binding protein
MRTSHSIALIKSAADPRDFVKGDLPEIAAVGRSNVGKSSLLNALAGVKRLAFVSKTPGRTQVVNFYRLGSDMLLVDLPGYGFAKAPISVRKGWERLVTSYLFERNAPRLVLLLVDMRRDPMESDLKVRDLLEEAGLPYVVVATKVDKLPRGQQRAALSRLSRVYGPAERAPIIPFSAVTSEGRKELWMTIERHVRESRRAPRI